MVSINVVALHRARLLLGWVKKVKEGTVAVNGNIPWHSYGVSLAIWDHTVLPATRHKWTHPALSPAMQAGIRFTYPRGMEGWVDLVDLIAPRPRVEPATFRSRVRRSTNATTKTTVTHSRGHCNTTNTLCPQFHTTFTSRSFSVAASSVWNSLPAGIHACSSPHTFHRLLKTYCLRSGLQFPLAAHIGLWSTLDSVDFLY